MTKDEVSLVDEALQEYPRSSTLWRLRGDLIQLMDEGLECFSLEDALRSYEHGLECNPEDPDVLEEIGHFYDLQNDRRESERYLRRAVEHGAGATAWAGLARVLAELGKISEALAILDPSTCPHANSNEVLEVREEITEGTGKPRENAG